MRESWGSTKPKGAMKVKGFLSVASGTIPFPGAGAVPARLVLFVGEAEQERTRWDPKDGELCEARSKSEETLMEDCSGSNVQIDRRSFV